MGEQYLASHQYSQILGLRKTQELKRRLECVGQPSDPIALVVIACRNYLLFPLPGHEFLVKQVSLSSQVLSEKSSKSYSLAGALAPGPLQSFLVLVPGVIPFSA